MKGMAQYVPEKSLSVGIVGKWASGGLPRENILR